jgi:hypothetical protein
MRPVRAAAARNTKNAAVAKLIKTKLSCNPLQAMIQMIIIVSLTESEHTVETLQFETII